MPQRHVTREPERTGKPEDVGLMTGQTIEFRDTQGPTEPSRYVWPEFQRTGYLRRALVRRSAWKKLPWNGGRNRSTLCSEEPRSNTPLRRNQPSRFARVAQLSASIVHQLNQPLTSMLANAQAAKRWLAAEPPNLMEAIASIDRIGRDVRTASETMRRIRALFKQKSLDKKEASVPDMMHEAVRLVLEDPNKIEVPIICHSDENLPKVWVDSLAIQEVFMNLISNAIEALEDHRNSPLIKIQAAVDDNNEMVIRVIDNGPGISEAAEIFEPFVTTKRNGLGIGLAVSRLIAEAHGGHLWAENNPSGGATFCLALPLSSRNQISAEREILEKGHLFKFRHSGTDALASTFCIAHE